MPAVTITTTLSLLLLLIIRLLLRPATKLELLFRKNLFPTALALAHSQGYPAAMIADIHRRHAEHLYAKGKTVTCLSHACTCTPHVAPPALQHSPEP